MLKHLKDRRVQLGIICMLFLVFLAGQLAYLTVEKGEELYAESLIKKRVEVKVKGTRGNILDRNDIPVAINEQIYTLQLDRQQIPTDHEKINAILLRILEIIYKNNDEDTLLDIMPIRQELQGGKFYYTWRDEEQEVQDKRYKRWSEDIGVKEKMDADEIMEYFKNERYEIDGDLSEEMAIGIISIRLNIFARRFTQYEPIPIASGISFETVVQIETFAPEMPGVQTIVDSGRYYPMGDRFSQIIGYLGSINKDQSENYIKKGYDISSDRIGQLGVESYAEDWLTASVEEKLGKLVAEKDSFGKVIRVLEETPPQNGDHVVLTLDNELQRAVTNILKEETDKMRDGLPPYDDEKYIAPLVEGSAAVVLDINTGEILSIVSYPSFDPNNLSKEGDQYSLAFQDAMIPGSVFKMLIGVAGLMEGVVTLDEEIYDKVKYDKYDSKDPPSCWSSSGHGNEIYVDALKHSCNYYFYEVADRLGVKSINKWAKLFGLDGHTGIEILHPDSNSNTIPSEEIKFIKNRNNMRILITEIMAGYGYYGREFNSKEKKQVRRYLPYEEMEIIREELSTEEEEQVTKIIDFPLSDDRSEEGGIKEIEEVTELLKSMGYTENARFAAQEIRKDVLTKLKRWTPSDTVQVGIGQGSVNITPLSMARYIAALANGGKVLETHLIKKIVDQEGNTIMETKPKVVRELDIDQEYLDATLEGMWKVVNDPNSTKGENDGGGSAVPYYKDLDPDITVAGKTGTAQIDSSGIEERNNAWFTAITPYEDPEIAVVVAIRKGRTSGNAAPTARRIIEQYYKQKAQEGSGDIPKLMK